MILDNITLNEDYFIINEGFVGSIKFPIGKKKNDKDALDSLNDTIKENKDKIEKMNDDELYRNFRTGTKLTRDIVFGWIKYGPLMGVAAIPFALSMSLLTYLLKKLAKLAKTQADKNFLIENLKMEIEQLKILRKNNSKNKKAVQKIDKTIDLCNNVIDLTLAD